MPEHIHLLLSESQRDANCPTQAKIGLEWATCPQRDTLADALKSLKQGVARSTALSIRKEESHRVAPVAELFAHIGSQKKLYRALADSGRLNDFFDLAQGYFARGIERRLRESNRLSKFPQRELGARASALAGSMLSLLRWWFDRGAKESPRAMDELFHRMVWNGLQITPSG